MEVGPKKVLLAPFLDLFWLDLFWLDLWGAKVFFFAAFFMVHIRR